jgi:chromosome segregation ATPase
MSKDSSSSEFRPNHKAVPRKQEAHDNRPENEPGKLSPRVTIPEVEPPQKNGIKLSIPLWLWAAVGLLVLIGAGISVFMVVRQTKVTFRVDAGDLKITDQPAVIYNFMGKVDLLRSDYARRMTPIDSEYTEVRNNLASARADMAGKLETKRLLKGEIQRLSAQIPDFIEQSQGQLNDLWVKQGAVLDKEYADTKEQYQKKLEDRAKQLGVDYQRNQDIDSIDVSVNAFKLSLYGAPKTVKVEDERKYAESLLAEWQKYQEDWQKRLVSMKDKSQQIRQQPGPKIEEVKAQVAKVQNDIFAVDADISSYQLEIQQYEGRTNDLNTQIQKVTKQFMDDLLSAPKEFIKTRLQLDGNGIAELKDLEDHKEDFPPGDYFLLVSAQKDDQVYWALKKFTIKEYSKSDVYILRSDFVLARSYLSNKQESRAAE